ncbi:hypothetical protein ANOM_007393 [Aspergillus nomiae NRRL 13137]|uniref:Aminoglycoside phosphotransferase domain-containing protein n=1 Tax=Aspergillus nomiae NRRL (strain ATCC 15546 / NRRL 13137 / CBS 260.88 / M93) TaxID=1509407 RepID=A0A0L1IW55_ASPN3|nr:uncharacterized protein ANOM_007393 [Aspergillus nomiae NRRL 13137]KNG83796.1 hypothetical protein ANOM_007393 [Aspergillus nomiae NRRL 13137]
MCGTEEVQTTEPQVHILCSAPGFTVPYPDDVDAKVTESNTIFNWGGVTIAKISPTLVVKFGSHVTLNEAKNMMFVGQNTDLPVPKVFACYSYGPIDRDIKDYGSLFDTYIFMSYVEGQTLDKVWDTYEDIPKSRITSQLKEYIHQLRQLRHENYIGSADFGPVTDPILETYSNKGPFDSEESFNNAIIEAYQLKAPKRHIKSFLVGMLSQKRYQIVFTHGDLRPQNIMVNHGNISGIVDWEFSGWYPEYWEFSNALYVWKWQNDWTNYLIQLLEPYYSEYAVHSFLTEVLW